MIEDISYKFLSPAYYGRVLEIFNLIDVKSKLILDIGCGRGDLSAIAIKKGAKVVALDSNAKDIMFAKKRAKDGFFIIADAEKLPFKNNVFDNVLCVETLQYLKKDFDCIKEIKRVAKHEAILEVPNKNYPFFRDPVGYLTKSDLANRSWGNVLRLYDNDGFLSKLKGLGFSVQKTIFIGHTLSSIFCFNYLALLANKIFLPKKMRSGYLGKNSCEVNRCEVGEEKVSESKLLKMLVKLVGRVYFLDSKLGKDNKKSISFIVKVRC